jgi:hypothetical protein
MRLVQCTSCKRLSALYPDMKIPIHACACVKGDWYMTANVLSYRELDDHEQKALADYVREAGHVPPPGSGDS